jgi:hypothetical protein
MIIRRTLWPAAAAAACLALAGSASASVPGLERTSFTTAPDSVAKTAGAACTSGKDVLGGGGEVTGGDGQVALTKLSFLEGLDPFEARASEDQTGFASDWSLAAYAICADELPGSGTIGLFSDTDSADKRLEVRCPAGGLLVGFGGRVNLAQDQVALTGVVPDADLGGVTIAGREDADGFTGAWQLGGEAKCAPALPGLTITSVPGAPSTDVATATAGCPAGKRVIGAGGEVVRRGTLDAIVPNAALTNVKVTARASEAPDEFWVRAYALCADA